MTVRIYRSDDASAPVLNGQAGSLVAVLDACLVNGYGAKASSGWGKAFSSGSDQAVYRAPEGTRHYLQVVDTGTNEARIRGYGAMTTVSAGTDPFPTDAQVSGGLFVRKSDTTDAVGRAWVLVATQRAFYFFPDSSQTLGNWANTTATSGCSGQFGFGQFLADVADSWDSFIIGAASTGTNAGRFGSVGSSAVPGHYLPRDGSGSGTSVNFGKAVSGDISVPTGLGSSSYGSFPDVYTGTMRVGKIRVAHATYVMRGFLPGLYGPLHNQPAQHGDTIDGSGALAGKTFLNVFVAATSTLGRVLVEISDTW